MKKVYENVEKYDFIAEVESVSCLIVEFEGIIIVGGKEYTDKCVLNESAIIYGKGITKFKFIGADIIAIHVEKNSEQTDANGMFSRLNKMHTFTANENCFSNVTSMHGTWYNCKTLTTFPNIDTSNVVDMNSTWYHCESLTTFPNIDTGNVTSTMYTWRGCKALTEFPLIDTSKVVNMIGVWQDCTSLTEFPLIDTGKVVNMIGVWAGCTSLTSFPLIDTGNVTDMGWVWERGVRTLGAYTNIYI